LQNEHGTGATEADTVVGASASVNAAKPSRAGFVALTIATGFCFSISSVPTPLYPLYIQAWQIPPSAVSDIFAVYMVAVLFTLVCLGRVSDTFGQLRVVLAAMGIVMLGIALSALAPNVGMLLAARVITGLGNGLLTTSATLALIDAHPTHDKRMASMAVAFSMTVGFGQGPLLSGAVAQLNVWPLVLPWVAAFAVIALCAGAVRYFNRHPASTFVRSPLSVRPALSLPALQTRKPFLLACLSAFANFTVGAVYFAHVPSLLRDMLPWQGTLAIGIAFIPMCLVCLIVQLTQNQIEPFRGLWRGMVCLVLTCLCSLWGVLPFGSPWALIAGIFFLGIGQGYTFMCSATIANLNADPLRRAANMSTYFLSAYMGASIPIMIIGRIADRVGLVPALTGYNLVFLLLVMAVGGLAYHQMQIAKTA